MSVRKRLLPMLEPCRDLLGEQFVGGDFERLAERDHADDRGDAAALDRRKALLSDALETDRLE